MSVSEVKSAVDWVIIEVDYRAGIKPLRLIGEENGISHVAINKRAKRDGWTRDLAAKIKAQADAKVTKAAVTAEVTKTQRVVTEKQVIDANADLQYRVRISQRGDVQRSRALMIKLLSELEELTDNKELFAALGELLDESGPDANGNWKTDKRNDLYAKVISLTGRVDNSKKLIEMLEKLVKLERQAFGITDGEDDSKGNIEDLLAKIGLKAKGLANG